MLAGRCLCPYPTCLARGARMLLMAPLVILGRCPRRPSCRRYWWTLEGRCRHPTSPGCCSRLCLLAGGGRGPRPSLIQLARVASLLLVAPSAILGRCPRRPSSRRYCWTLEGRRRHPTSPGCCSRLSLLAPLAYGEHCRGWTVWC